MISVVDQGIANVTDALKTAGRWNDAFVLCSSDNGGISKGNNWPLRGHKMLVWEGGTRVAAFVAGGFIPARLRGTASQAYIHIADWCESAPGCIA